MFNKKEYNHVFVQEVLAVGMRSRSEKVQELRRAIAETEVYLDGDAKKPESVGEAVHAAFAAANQL